MKMCHCGRDFTQHNKLWCRYCEDDQRQARIQAEAAQEQARIQAETDQAWAEWEYEQECKKFRRAIDKLTKRWQEAD